MNRVEVQPKVLRWARERAGFSVGGLSKRFPQLEAWERGELRPTLKQLESFAKATYTPVGFLFLENPPVERIPIPDLRTVGNAHVGHPSPDLLDMVYACQQRQEWYRDFARSGGEAALAFVGSAQIGSDVVATAAAMRRAIGFDLEERRVLCLRGPRLSVASSGRQTSWAFSSCAAAWCSTTTVDISTCLTRTGSRSSADTKLHV